MSCAHCPTQTRLLNRSRQGKQPSWRGASKAIATGDPRRNCAIASSFWLTMAWRPAQPCALRSRHCVSAVLRKLSWQYQLGPRTLAANSKTKLTRRFAQARRNSFRQSASITKISRRQAMKKCASCSRAPRKIEMTEPELVREVAQPLTGSTDDYGALLELIGEARLVLLGEASHGTHEFYFERATITKRLIAEKGFTVLAIEADWPDAARVHRYVRGTSEDPNAREALSGFRRFPTWMWRNTVVVEFVEWLRGFNKDIDPRRAPAGFYGMDLYSLHASIDAVLNYLEKIDPEAAKRARLRYSCFDHGSRQPKAIIWAHNSHLGDARATEMSQHGELNVGQLVRERFGNEAVLIGFSTHRGTVTAASDWGARAERKNVRPALRGSYEELFHQTGLPRFWIDLRKMGDRISVLSGPRLGRAIGVVYRPETERLSHYFHARLSEQFDAIIHIDETSAVEPLERTSIWEEGELPETYPFAV